MYETEALNCILDKLEVFCKNKILWFDPQNEFSQINKFRQKSTRELYIIDYLIMIQKLIMSEKDIAIIFDKRSGITKEQHWIIS